MISLANKTVCLCGYRSFKFTKIYNFDRFLWVKQLLIRELLNLNFLSSLELLNLRFSETNNWLSQLSNNPCKITEINCISQPGILIFSRRILIYCYNWPKQQSVHFHSNEETEEIIASSILTTCASNLKSHYISLNHHFAKPHNLCLSQPIYPRGTETPI